jgi:tagatose-1,6-bisphosphate aldolase
MTSISVGKFRALQQCGTSSGALAVFALDHRSNLKASLNPAAPDTVSEETLTGFKQQVVKAVGSAGSAVLLDPQYGAGQCIASGALPGNLGLLVAVEESGYGSDPHARQLRMLPNWGVDKAKRMGASGVKLLAYYHPESPTAALVEDLIKQVVADCNANELPVFLEPISYSPDPNIKKLSPDERRRVVIETARRLTALGVDILKAEFPLDAGAVTDEKEWEKACAELSAASSAPWVLLSASVSFEVFLRQVTAACRAGASGVAVGRAVWQEATGLTGEARATFLKDVARPRMERITALCNALARPWTDFYPAPAVNVNWYPAY